MLARAMDRSTIRHVARLAELSLSEEEEVRLSEEMGRILAYVAELQALNTDDVPPTTNLGGDGTDALRDDVPTPGLARDEVLAQAPRVEHDGFSVPTFVEGS